VGGGGQAHPTSHAGCWGRGVVGRDGSAGSRRASANAASLNSSAVVKLNSNLKDCLATFTDSGASTVHVAVAVASVDAGREPRAGEFVTFEFPQREPELSDPSEVRPPERGVAVSGPASLPCSQMVATGTTHAAGTYGRTCTLGVGRGGRGEGRIGSRLGICGANLARRIRPVNIGQPYNRELAYRPMMTRQPHARALGDVPGLHACGQFLVARRVAHWSPVQYAGAGTTGEQAWTGRQ
jgi:hypothetical protein